MGSPSGLVPVPVAWGTPRPPLSPDAEGSALELRRQDVDAHRLDFVLSLLPLHQPWRSFFPGHDSLLALMNPTTEVPHA